jgi:glycolate dehydrogenase FAD-linked subunit
MESTPFLSALGRFYSDARLLTRHSQLVAYESDALTAFRSRPLAVVLPESQEEVIETVRVCHQFQKPFVARGSGTSLSGGSLPIKEGIVIALNRLNHILNLDPQDRTIVVEPGVINADVSRAASVEGLYYAPDPSSQSVCTIGGNVAFNSGGAHCLRHGMTSNHVLGIKAVLPDGNVVELGGKCLERVGPAWTGFFVGSEGLFGIALELTLRLSKMPESYRTLLSAYKDLEAAGSAVSRIVASGLLPGALEIMDRLAMKAAEAAVGATFPVGAGAVLIVELEGERVEVEADFHMLRDIITQTSPVEVRVAQDETERMLIWKGRKGAFSSVGRLSPDYIVQDGVVPRNRLGEALAEIQRLSAQYDIPIANVFHAGDGNLHPLILFDGGQAGALHRAEEVAGKSLDMCIRLGGSITGEHGVGVEKREYLARMFSKTDLWMMHRVRKCIDPLELSNRGKMLDVEKTTLDAADAESARSVRHHSHPPSNVGLLEPRNLEEVQEAVRQCPQLRIRGGGSKPGLSSAPKGIPLLDLKHLAGIVEYKPEEFTVTALAGTPVTDVERLLSSWGQCLPFDPILPRRGATMGGTVAAGTSGPGRFRSGGIRDFILSLRFVEGTGECVRGGARVVKNAAGFDFPKLMVGSMGCLGVLIEVTFKVFPQFEGNSTLRVSYGDFGKALESLCRLQNSPVDFHCLDIEPPGTLWIRLGGRSQTLNDRLLQLINTLGKGDPIEEDQEDSYWQSIREFDWAPPGFSLVKVALTPSRVLHLENHLRESGAVRRYSAGGQIAWVSWPGDLAPLESILRSVGLPGIVIWGSREKRILAEPVSNAFATRVKQALDVQGRFGKAQDAPRNR